MGNSFTVDMSEWLFQQAFTCGMFWLHRQGRWYLIHLECFDVDELWFKNGSHCLGFRLKEGEHWGRLVYWRLFNGGKIVDRAERHWHSGVAAVQGER